jgi:dTDP-4-amino-4,6-dideoxygalactose transaminase
MERMKARGVQTSIHYPPIHQFSAYRELPSPAVQDLKVTENVAARQVTLPLYPAMTESDVTCVVEALRDALVEAEPSSQ